ncbi:acyltransferase family protein [Pseudomonas fluorescens]|uniref:Acyltransferase n=1 Tax=Pseudomonas fluorescens TaxID=294 RepID=A0A944HB13_PSEFL|nr:acyltransferase family protein [Pseudomonas fluorescens]MBT2294395.1 acyltransferase [Pseudomonas fluorescens]MBT2306949.1 acyltransferase [Pseudomonas fluorescens]MBT2316141.1 acyltransferase [Pseudomonas fluorescens]MBT2327596.1 acyltransferase [Pseudomonas fluorescens]MBT2342623.1 acyltransferase [Pseudomonas fluorescens]
MKRDTQLRNDIQGLRAIAVISVIIYHFNKNWLPGGFIGVDIFFVISGFLITGIILRRQELGTFSILEFYVKRALRIFPAYAALLVIVTFFMAALLIPNDWHGYSESALAALRFNSNNFFASQNDYFAPAAYELPLLHTWSLAVEMQFYLILPFVLVFASRRFVAPILICVAIVALLYSEYNLQSGHRQSVYFSLSARIPEFILGGLVAFCWRSRSFNRSTSNTMSLFGAGLIVVSMWLITEEDKFPGILAIPACVGVVLLLTSEKSQISEFMSSAPLVFIGALSYSLYLWHWPILAAIRYITGEYNIEGGAAVVFVLLTTCLAYISYRFIETPLRLQSSWKNTAFRLSVLGAIVALAVALTEIINVRLVPPMPVNLTRYAAIDEICHKKSVGNCVRGDAMAGRILLMLGDSHGAQLNKFADVVGENLGVGIRIITSSGCVTIPGFDVERIVEWARKDCENQIAEAGKYIGTADAVIIAGMWQMHAKSDKFMTSFDTFLSVTAEKKQKVLVLAQIPMLETNPQRAYRLNHLGIVIRGAKNPESDIANSKIKKIVSQHSNAVFFDFSKESFFADAPTYNGSLIYQDTHHLNETGSIRYGEFATPFLQEFLDRVYARQKAMNAGGLIQSYN